MGLFGLDGFRSSKVWHCIARLLCGLRAHPLQVSSKVHLDEFAGSELSAFCRQPAGTLARGIYMLSLSNPFGLLVGISAVVHLMDIILVPFQMFVKYRLFVKTLAGYNLLCGVSVGFSGYYIDTHTSSSTFHFDTHHHSGFCFGTCQVLLWNLVRASLERAGSPFRIGTDPGGGG